MENRISVNIPDEVVEAFNTKMKEGFALITPYIFTVTDEQKKSLLRIGDKTQPFANKSKEYSGGTGNDLTPTFLDTEEFDRDLDASGKYKSMKKVVEPIFQALDDSYSLAANDAYAAALIYYSAVKSAAKAGVAHAKVIYEDLSQRFPGRGKSSDTTATT